MRTIRNLTFSTLLALGLATPPAAHSQLALGNAEAIKASTSDKSPGAILIPGNEGSWSLVSDGKDSRVVAKLGWLSPAGAFAFGIESSANVQKGSPDTELLNLDGLTGGDSSVSGQFSYRRFGPRVRANLRGVCDQVNLAVEQQIRDERDGQGPFRGNTCTVQALVAAGGPWATEADKVESGAVAWACDELTKLNPDVVLTLPNAPLVVRHMTLPRFGKTGDCTPDAFANAALAERTRRESTPEFLALQNRAQVARNERTVLLGKIATNEAAFAAATDPTERTRLTAERLLLAALVTDQDKIIAKSESAIEKALPKLLTEPKETLQAKMDELLAAACKRFNEPDRSTELVLVGFDPGCKLGRIEKSIASLSDPRERDRLRLAVVANLPARVWAVTFRGGIDKKGFKFVDPDALPGYTSFEQLEEGVQSETEHDSLVGVAGTLQDGANFWRLGYDRKNVHQGGDPADTCVPAAAGSTVQRCTSVVLGRPKGADEEVATIEYRRLVTSKLGLSVKGLYLIEAVRKNKPVSDEWEGHLVLYFLTHTTNGLNGGIDVAYDSLAKEAGIRLFIGQSFSLFD
jgi:hypothetical protein